MGTSEGCPVQPLGGARHSENDWNGRGNPVAQSPTGGRPRVKGGTAPRASVSRRRPTDLVLSRSRTLRSGCGKTEDMHSFIVHDGVEP